MSDEMNYGYGNPEEPEKTPQEPNYGEPIQYNYGTSQNDNRTQSYDTIPHYEDPYKNGTPEEPSGMAIASLVLGIISLVISCLGYNIITGILAIIFGAIHLAKHSNRRGMAIAGLVMGIVSIVLFIILVVIGVGLMVSNPTLYNEILNEL